MYLGFLVIALSGLAVIDWRCSLALFHDLPRTLKTIGIGIVLFCVWDIFGIIFEIFFVGETKYLTGLRLLPEFPIEELFFLTLLCYNALILWRVLEVRWPRI